MSIAEEVDKFAVLELERFREVALIKLAQTLKQRQLVLSGDTLGSLQGEVVEGAQAGITQLLLAFQESGRIQDMSRVFYKKLPPQTVIEEFVRKVGVEKFEYVPGYPLRTIPTEQIAIKRIAWGIRVHKKATNEHRPAKWYAKPFYSLLNGLIDGLVTRYQEATGQVIGGSFNNV